MLTWRASRRYGGQRVALVCAAALIGGACGGDAGQDGAVDHVSLTTQRGRSTSDRYVQNRQARSSERREVGCER